MQGELINAVTNGGEKAMWNIARGSGKKSEAARQVIEMTTSPFQELSWEQAIVRVCDNFKG